MISAIFFPRLDGEILFCDAQALAMKALQNGLRLYTDGKRWALLSKPLPGWALFTGGHEKCAA